MPPREASSCSGSAVASRHEWDEVDCEAAALIEEARQRQRRRRQLGSAILLLVLIAGVVLYVVLSRSAPPPARAHPPVKTQGEPVPRPIGSAVVPEQPRALAVGPNGNLYIADPGRNEILERHADGTFTVVAGTGTVGLSGDGGLATEAKLNLSYGGGMAFGSDGTLYIADSGNWRVRAVSPTGIIRSLAGSRSIAGQQGDDWVTDGTPAFDAILNVSDVAVGPGGHLYVSTDREILRLEKNGTFTRVVGTYFYDGIYGVGRPAIDASADSPDGMAFDSSGDLFFTGFATKTLHMVTPGGTMTLPIGPENFYARGAGGLATTPDGGVIGMNSLVVDRLSPHSASPIKSFLSSCPYPDHGSFLGIQCFLPNGIAVGREGTIYSDTDYGNGYTDKTAIVAISADGKSSHLLWEPSGRAQ